tara:strand:+ start:1711 stop:3210 length:1500 start_codon:yes stop_codon:yes gene_type:complete
MTYLNFTDSHIVLGGGLSGLVTARELLKANKKVVMLDAGILESKRSDRSEFTAYKRNFKSPKFSFFDNSFAFSNFKRQLKIKEINFKSVGSLAYGGLSNIWGADIRAYNKEDLSSSHFSYKEYERVYSDLYKLITNVSDQDHDYERLVQITESKKYPHIDSRCKDLINSEILKKNGIYMEHSNLAILYKDKNDRKKCNYEGECLNNPPYVFNAKFEIDELKQNKNFTYIPNTFIQSIKKDKDKYLIKTTNLKDSKITLFKTDKVFCSLGALSTTKLVLKMIGLIGQEVPLFSTPGASFILFSFKKKRQGSTEIAASNANFEINHGNEVITGGLFPFPNDWWVNKFGRGPISLAMLYILDKIFFSRVLVCSLNFSSNYSSNFISLNEEDELEIRGNRHSESLKSAFKTLLKTLSKAFRLESYYILPLSARLFQPGEDLHLGGTFAINNSDTSFCDSSGQLKGMLNFFITDPSSMPFLAGKGHSFTSMAQSALIVKNYCDS